MSEELALIASAIRKLAEELREVREDLLPSFAAKFGAYLDEDQRRIAVLEEIVADHEAHLLGGGKPEFLPS